MNAAKSSVLCVLIGVSQITQAACAQSNLKGTWHDFAMSHQSGAVEHCILNIDKKGKILPTSTCWGYAASSDTQPEPISELHVIESTCGVITSIDIPPFIVGSDVAAIFFEGQMSKDKQTITGISRDADGTRLHYLMRQ